MSEVDLLRRHSNGHDLGRNGQKLDLRYHNISRAPLPRRPPLYLRCPGNRRATSAAPPPLPHLRHQAVELQLRLWLLIAASSLFLYWAAEVGYFKQKSNISELAKHT